MSGKRSAAGGKGNRRVGKGKNLGVRWLDVKATESSPEQIPSLRPTQMSTFFRGKSANIPFLPSRSSFKVVNETEKDPVLEWMSSALSSGLSSSTSTSQTLQSSEVSPQSHLPPQSSQVSSRLTDSKLVISDSAELFTHTIAWESEVFSKASLSEDEEIMCTDAQNLCESDTGPDEERSEHNVEPQSKIVTPAVGDDEADDDETQIPDSNANLLMRSRQKPVGSQEDEGEDPQGDDEVTDPTYCQPTGRQSGSSAEEDASDEVRLRLPGQRQSLVSSSPTTSSATTLPLCRSGGGYGGRMSAKPCLAWAFFETVKNEPTHVICLICKQKLSRGQKMNNLTTSCMNCHMDMKHRSKWEAHCAAMRPSWPDQPLSGPSRSPGVSSSSVTVGTAVTQPQGRTTSTSSPIPASVSNRSSVVLEPLWLVPLCD